MEFRFPLPVSRALFAGLVATTVTVATVTVAPRAASADEQQSVQAQIGALRSQLAATGRSVYQLTEAYDSDQVEEAALIQQLAVDRARADQAAAALASTGAALRQALVEAYTGGYSRPAGQGYQAAGAAATGGDVNDPAVRYGYVSIVSSGVQDTIDSYRASRVQLTTALATVTAETRAATAAAQAAGEARSAALAQATRATTHLATLESKLTTLEQQAAAEKAARPRISPGRNAGPVVQGGPVNGGLAKVVRAQVDLPASPPPPPTTAPTTAPTTVPATLPPVVSTTAPPPPRPVPITAAPPTTTVAASPAAPAGDVWLQLRECESGNDYQANTGNGFYGAYQFTQQTWTGLGYPGRPDLEPPAMQDQAAQKLQAEAGWGQWPACAAALGLT